MASAEAPILAILVLMAPVPGPPHRRAAEEIGLQVRLHAERQASALLEMVDGIRREMGIGDVGVPDLDALTARLDPRDLVEDVADELEESEEGGSRPD